MGKRKYRSIGKANRNSCFQERKLPNFIPYPDLAKFISGLDIGEIKPVHILDGVNIEDSGSFREIREFIPRLAEFYIKVDKDRVDKFLSFDKFEKKDKS